MNRRAHWITCIVLPIVAGLLGFQVGDTFAGDKWQETVDEIRVACEKQTAVPVTQCLIALGATI